MLGENMSDRRNLDLAGLLAEVRRRAWLVVLCTLSAAVLAFGISQLIDERYEATADLLFAEEDPDSPERTAATNLELASLDSVMFRVKRRIGSDDPADELRKQFDLEPLGQSDIVRVTASAPTARGAAARANIFAREVVALRRDRAQQALQRQLTALDAEIEATGGDIDLNRDLVQRRKALAVERALATGDVEVADPAVPPRRPAAPRPVRYAAIAGLLGLLFAIGLVFVLRSVQRRIDEKDVSRIFGAPILARVPTRRRQAWREQLYLEAFQFLRANVATRLAKRGDGEPREGRVIAVTSPLPGERQEHRRGRAVRRAGAQRERGAGDRLRPAQAGARRGVRPARRAAAAWPRSLLSHDTPDHYLVETPVPGVTLLPGGLLGADFAVAHATARRLPDVINGLRSAADVVLVDTAPVTLAAETSIVAAVADYVIVVIDARDLRRDMLEDSREQLDRAGANILGIVLNRTEVAEDRMLKSAYGRPYRASRSLRAPEPEPEPIEPGESQPTLRAR